MRYKYIHFIERKPEKPRKTKMWECRNNKSNFCLGEVAWYSSWRQYCFEPPFEPVVFSASCLADIIDFLDKQNKGYRKPKGEEKV